MKIRSIYTPRKMTGTIFPLEEKLTESSHQPECDINRILSRHQEGIPITHINNQNGTYEDYQPEDLLQALLVTKTAQQSFEELPSSIRKKFENSPMKFLEFVHDPENQAELVKMGLATNPQETDLTVKELAESINNSINESKIVPENQKPTN